MFGNMIVKAVYVKSAMMGNEKWLPKFIMRTKKCYEINAQRKKKSKTPILDAVIR